VAGECIRYFANHAPAPGLETPAQIKHGRDRL